MDHNGCRSVASDLSIEEVIEEYNSRPSQIAEWLWCIEYVAKYFKDIHFILGFMKLGYRYWNNRVKRINEVLSLRILEFMFDVNVVVASTSAAARVEFDLSLSSADVLKAILKEIPVSELRAGMPELYKFNVLPFIAHKNACLQQCALEKLKDLILMKNQMIADPHTEAEAPVLRDDRSVVDMDTCEEERLDEQQAYIGLGQNINDEDKPVEVIVIDDDTENDQDTSKDASVQCTKDGIWLIIDSDDDEEEEELDMVKSPALMNNTDTSLLPQSSRARTEGGCWKCGKEGTLLIYSGSKCALKVHKGCLNCAVNVHEDGNSRCPVCWYNQVAEDNLNCQKLINSAKRKLVNLLPLLSTRSNRLI